MGRMCAGDLDKRAGQLIRARRVALGLTQEDIGRALGITYQQAYKYERGIDRLPVGRLAVILTLLKLRPEEFFRDLTGAPSEAQPRDRHALEVAKNMGRLSYRKQQAVSLLVASLANEDEGASVIELLPASVA